MLVCVVACVVLFVLVWTGLLFDCVVVCVFVLLCCCIVLVCCVLLYAVLLCFVCVGLIFDVCLHA